MRLRTLVLSSVLIIPTLLQACGDPKVMIVVPNDLPSTIPAGETFKHRFEAKPTLEGGAFLGCGPRTNAKVEVNRDGTLVFHAATTGMEVELCIAYRNRDGGTVAKHTFKMTVGPRAQATDEDFRAPVATHRKRLRALVRAATQAKAGAGATEACAKVAVPVAEPMPYTIYDSGWVDAALDLEAPNLKAGVLLGPEEALRALLTEAEQKPDSFEQKHLGRTYAVVLTTTKLVRPNLVVPEKFALAQRPSFQAGSFEGRLHIGKLEDGAIVCSVPLSFRSSETIKWTDWVKEGEPKDATAGRLRFKLWEDFGRNGMKALREALAAPK